MAQIIKKNSGWSYRVARRVNGKRVTHYKSGFATKTDAIKAAREIENELDKGNQINNNISFADYYMRWFKDVKAGQYVKNTENRYRHVGKLIINYFADKPLNKIVRRDYQAFLNSYANNHAKESVQKVNSYVREMVDSAIDEGIIYKDFTKRVRNNGKVGKQASEKYLNANDFKQLIACAKHHLSINSITTYMIVFSAFTGARYEEVCGITWDDIDFDKKTVHIHRAYDYTTQRGFKPLKNTSSNRVIIISNNLIDILKQLKKQQNEYYLKHGYRDNDNLLFRSINNGFKIPTDNAANKTLKLLQNEIGVDKTKQITFHGLRHTHASYLISNNIPISYVSKRLGHKDINTTLAVYAHLLTEMEQLNGQQAQQILQQL